MRQAVAGTDAGGEAGERRRAERGETWAVTLYRLMLRLYPAEFRHEYGRELCLVLADSWRGARPSPAARAMVWLEAVTGVLLEAPKEHGLMILQDLRFAWRVLRKDAAVTAAAVAILALGIGATTVVFSLANGILLRPLPFPHAEQLVAIDEHSRSDARAEGQVAFPNYADLRTRSRLLAELAVYSSDNYPLRAISGSATPGAIGAAGAAGAAGATGAAGAAGAGSAAAEEVAGAQVSDGFFGVFGLTPRLGRVFTRAEDRPHGPAVVVLSEGLWRRRYGADPAIIGRQLGIGADRCTVIGVMPAAFNVPDRAELWLPMHKDPASAPRTDYFLRAVARLRPGVSVAQASAEMRLLLLQIQHENPAANNHYAIRARPLREVMAGSFRQAVLVLGVAVALLLLIACANVSNLLLVKASARTREMALRTALGAGRGRLVRQLTVESLVLGLAGGLGGTLLTFAGLPALLALLPVALPRWLDFPIDQRVFAFALAASCATSALFGLVPAWSAARHGDLTRALKEGARSGTPGAQRRVRNALVIAEVALSVTLLVGAGLLCRSFLALTSQDLGYAAARVLAVSLDIPDRRYPDGPAARALLTHIRSEIQPLPGVATVAFATGVPLDDGWGRLLTVEGRPLPLADMPTVNHVVVTPGYFAALGIPLLRGRDFNDDDFAAPHVVVVSAAFAAHQFPRGDVLGKRLRFGPPRNQEPWHTIVGVVADSRHGQIKGEDRANIYLPASARWTPATLVVRAAGDPHALVPAIRARLAAVDRDIVVSNVQTLREIASVAAWRDRFSTVLFAVFAALALLLAAVGLYAVLSYTVSLRAAEIGIRMALGATVGRVRAMVLRQGLGLAAAGLALGLAAALALTRLIQSQLFGIGPTDALTWSLVPVVFLLTALLASLLPGRRAARIDPGTALREE